MVSEVISKKFANYLVESEGGVPTNSENWIGGNAILTAESLSIQPNAANALNSLLGLECSGRLIALDSVRAVSIQSGLGMDTLTVSATSGVYKIRVYGAKAFKTEIELALERAKQPNRAPRAEASEQTLPPEPAIPAASPKAFHVAAEADGPPIEPPFQPAIEEPHVVPNSETTVDAQLGACTHCGHPVSPYALACPICKKSLGASAVDAGVKPPPAAAVDATVRERLRAFEQHAHVNCFECGYDGRMGVVSALSDGKRMAYIGGMVLLAMFVGTLFDGMMTVVAMFAVLGGGMYFHNTHLDKSSVMCPSCETINVL